MTAAASPSNLATLREAYGLLGVPWSAAPIAIKRQYRSLAKQWHPDRFAMRSALQARATVQMTRINTAYRLIQSAPLLNHAAPRPHAAQQASPPQRPVATPSATTAPGRNFTRFNEVLDTSLRFATAFALGFLTMKVYDRCFSLPTTGGFGMGISFSGALIAQRYGRGFWLGGIAAALWLLLG